MSKQGEHILSMYKRFLCFCVHSCQYISLCYLSKIYVRKRHCNVSLGYMGVGFCWIRMCGSEDDCALLHQKKAKRMSLGPAEHSSLRYGREFRTQCEQAKVEDDLHFAAKLKYSTWEGVEGVPIYVRISCYCGLVYYGPPKF